SSWSATVPAALAEGTYTINVTATDAAGNTGPGSATNGLVIDTHAPDTAITTPTATMVGPNNWPNPITGTATNDAGPAALQRVEVRIVRNTDGPEWNGTSFVTTASPIFTAATGTTSWTFAFPFANFPADGTYNITARAVDAAGNVDASPAAVTVT